MINKKIKESR